MVGSSKLHAFHDLKQRRQDAQMGSRQPPSPPRIITKTTCSNIRVEETVNHHNASTSLQVDINLSKCNVYVAPHITNSGDTDVTMHIECYKNNPIAHYSLMRLKEITTTCVDSNAQDPAEKITHSHHFTKQNITKISSKDRHFGSPQYTWEKMYYHSSRIKEMNSLLFDGEKWAEFVKEERAKQKQN